MGAARADEGVTPLNCVQAYEVLDHLSHKAQGMIYQQNQEHKTPAAWAGLGDYAANFHEINFDTRARDLAKRFPEKVDADMDVLGANMAAAKTVDNLILEGPGVRLNALLAPQKIFEQQRPWFERTRACDIEYGYKPALGTVPDNAQIVAKEKAQMDREKASEQAHMDSLTDMQCTVRFAGLASAFPAGSQGQQLMQQSYMAGIQRLQPVISDVGQERAQELLKREMAELSTLVQSKRLNQEGLIEEVHACETKFGLPVSNIR